MKRLDKKLFEYLKSHPKVTITPQAIRNEISKIRECNPGITLNAAAYVFAKKRDIRVMKYLTFDDRTSIQYVRNVSVQPKKTSVKSNKIKVKPVITSFAKHFLTDANQNADIYPYVYILENSLRKLIQDTFNSESDWWLKRTSQDVKDYAERIQQAEKKHDWLPKRGNHPIYYIGLNELFKIISKNYSTHFKNVFKDQGHLRTWIDEVVPIRNLLSHNVKVKKEERENLKIRTKYICTLIENNTIQKGQLVNQ